MLDFFLTADPLFKASILSCEKCEEREIMLPIPGFLFVLESKADIKNPLYRDLCLQEGQILFLSSGISYSLRMQNGFYGIIFQIPDMKMFCYHFFPSSVFEKKVIFQSCLYALFMNKPQKMIIDEIKNYLLNGLHQPILLNIKALEIFCFFTLSNTEDSLAYFFAPLVSSEFVFSKFVLEYCDSVRTVEELARLSHYSNSGFQKQFRKVFGVAPYQWMVKRKTEKIYHEIHATSKPLKVIAEEAGFAGLSQLCDFCRKRLGKSPAAIRGKR